MESYEGMRETVTHLIEAHGYRRLAFVRGPEGHPYAQDRYRAYCETLQAYGIPFNPDLVSLPGTWSSDTARMAMQTFLDERKLRPHHDFEAIVCANDGLAVAVLKQQDA